MEYFYNLLFYFAIYSFAGWCGEVVFATVRHGKFVNRGMLHGAYCPIYGFGLITVIVCLTPIKDSWLLLFAGSAVLTTVLEFITGFVLDKLFGRRWWDYSDKKFNIGGYICPQFTVVWGLACLLAYNEGGTACDSFCRRAYLEACRHSGTVPVLCGNNNRCYTDLPRGKEAEKRNQAYRRP